MAVSHDDLQNLLSRARVPGASMAVVRRGTVEASTAGLADTQIRAEVDRDTIFDAASLGKPIFVACPLKSGPP